ncbi:4-amino-4-deoxy-L-arabinose-phosphoundecaprenol flippase subunit ArnF [Kosakonia oryzae]|uniref:Probable 4-amino-4-deoxy-L-arabinose-phosphoundecaprenol flippase subunit ArnF n=1 Tax=Kosakonia oryzae TaxID=497725 RepID=A0AA94H891_9ENTR|nr:4-amino-4-deoxy-L-arabinose-phosphoundecaprenol flippase subunit ArnF [Kosakonia oryzae]ANI80849.1 4-amino-4-deoxy-L-arabinose-phospho-UDP flippase [Kosakonia oryzae]SFD20992.1 undecaprenyl phosphate-alpha-L-ara4N flippase subunit ArnF [Kosakonia oryzae]
MRGMVWALASVLLVSVAQLLLRYAMVSLPPVSLSWEFVSVLLQPQKGTLALIAGLFGYLASMGCWYFALHRLPLSKAYALLSVSYILVWVAAIWLPGWHEPFSLRGGLGVLLIVAGVLVIFLPGRSRAGRQRS